MSNLWGVDIVLLLLVAEEEEEEGDENLSVDPLTFADNNGSVCNCEGTCANK